MKVDDVNISSDERPVSLIEACPKIPDTNTNRQQKLIGNYPHLKVCCLCSSQIWLAIYFPLFKKDIQVSVYMCVFLCECVSVFYYFFLMNLLICSYKNVWHFKIGHRKQMEGITTIYTNSHSSVTLTIIPRDCTIFTTENKINLFQMTHKTVKNLQVQSKHKFHAAFTGARTKLYKMFTEGHRDVIKMQMRSMQDILMWMISIEDII